MRRFTHPAAPITKTSRGEPLDKPLTFAAFFEAVIDGDRRTGESRANGKIADRAIALVQKSTPGESVELEDADYSLISQIFAAPTSGYNPAIARAIGPWVDAILGAHEAK